MNIRLIPALLAFAFLVVAPLSAHSATVDFDKFHYNMGLVEAGDEGTIATYTRLGNGGFQYDYAYGLLPSNTAITFTYAFATAIGTWDYVQGEAAYKDAPYHYRAAEDSNGWTLSQKAKGNHAFHDTTDPLAVSIDAVMAADRQSATVTITNFADVAANFASFFLSYCPLCSKAITTSYAVSSVPLPAALPLFGLGLAGMVAFGRRKTSVNV